MLHRRIQLGLLAALLAGSVLTGLEAGPRRRVCCEPIVYVEPPKMISGVTPIYKWFENETYALWYAVQCDQQTPAQPVGPPVNYDGSAGLPSGFPGANVVSEPAVLYEGGPSAGHVQSDLREGYAGTLIKRKPIPRSGKATIKAGPNGEELTVDFQNRELVNRHLRIPGTNKQVHVMKVSTRIVSPLPPHLLHLTETTFNAGYQMHQEANPGNPHAVTAHSDPSYSGVLLVNLDGETYPVVMHK